MPTQSHFSHRIQLEAVPQLGGKVGTDIQILGHVSHRPEGKGLQHAVVETDVVVPHHEVCHTQLINERLHLVFGVDMVGIVAGGIGDTHGHAHLGCFMPATYFGSGTAGFQVKINDILHNWPSGRVRRSPS